MTHDSHLVHCITSLERWGMRAHGDFQPASAAFVRDAGYTGVLANGGSGIGPDMLLPESLVETTTLPDLMPLTAKANAREMERRCRILKDAGLKPWLCLWGVPGPDESRGSEAAESNRFFDRRSKLEMQAKLRRTPEIFGRRNPAALSWRGNRPLCVSHPLVQQFYRELYTLLPSRYPELEGIFYFPGDADAELCDETCPRCRASGLDSWGVLIRHVNEIYAALQAAKPGIPFYFTVWNQDHPRGRENITRFLTELAPGIGICMSMSDNIEQTRKCGKVIFNQPWSNVSDVGELFQWTAEKAYAEGRSVMGLGELSQSEVWDPVCHNIPLPRKALEFLKNAEVTNGVNAVCDFWGNRSPFLSHASHAAMRAYFCNPKGSMDELLHSAAVDHYSIDKNDAPLLDQAIECWNAFQVAVDTWALTGWAQRFSFAIGRDAARGRLYQALVPPFLKTAWDRWEVRISILHDGDVCPEAFARCQQEDCEAFLAVARRFEYLAHMLQAKGLINVSALAYREACNIELAGALIASEGRTIHALHAYHNKDVALLRSIIEEEIDARERQLEISGRLGWGGGVNALLVSEDIQNMRLFLSSDDFPNTSDEYFHFTETPYSM